MVTHYLQNPQAEMWSVKKNAVALSPILRVTKRLQHKTHIKHITSHKERENRVDVWCI